MNLNELTEFWDAHDTEDYPDAWKEVEFESKPKTQATVNMTLAKGIP